MQEEKVVNQVVGSIMLYDSVNKAWNTAGQSSGLSTVRILYNSSKNIFRIHGQKLSQPREVVIDCPITHEMKYNRPNDAFIQWHDSRGTFWGLNFRQGSPDALSFFTSVLQVLEHLNGRSLPDIVGNAGPVEQTPPKQANQATINQGRPMVHQPMRQQQQQVTQQPMLHQQQQQPMVQQQSQMLSHVPPTQLIQLQQQHQAQQQMSQPQQQLHHFMQQAQPQTQQPNINQMNHYQPQQSNNLHQPAQQQQQTKQPQQQQLVQQQLSAPVAAAPIPPPPPPPPAPPALNNWFNGTGGVTDATTNDIKPNNIQHSPVANNSFENGANRSGGSPNQTTSLASELAKCQLKKVNRADSDKESECNNNSIIANAKTTRAASLAYVPDNLMNDLNRKLASRRERIDQQGDGPAASNNTSGNGVSDTNGVGSDKGQESWLADLIRREISQQLCQMKSEIIEAIKTELRQR